MAESPGGRRARVLIAHARATNAKRDAIDREAGFAAPGDAGAALWLRTAIDAILAGLTEVNWDAVAEGYVMLQDLHLKTTGIRYQPESPPPKP